MTNFQDTLRAIRHQENWILCVESLDSPAGPIVQLACPWKEDDLADFLRDNGIGDGKYRVAIEPSERGQAEKTKASAKSRLRKHGPISTVVAVGDIPEGRGASPTALPFPTSAPKAPARSAFSSAAPGADPAIAASHRAAAEAQAKAAELRAQMDLKRVEREYEAATLSVAAPAPTTAIEVQLARLEARLERLADERSRTSSNSIAELLTALAPFVQAFQQSTTRRDELFLGLLAGGDQQTPPSGVDTVQGTMELTRTFLEMMQTYSGGGEGSGGMLGDVASILRSMQGAAGSLPAPPAPGARRRPPGPRGQLKPEDDVRVRVLMFVEQVHRFASQETDPDATADALEPAFGLLPKDFRELVLGSNVDAMVAGLARWLPQAAHQKLTGLLATQPTRRRWIEEFQSSLRGDDDELEEDDTEEIGTIADGRDFGSFLDPDAAAAADRTAAMFPETEDPFGAPGPVGPKTNGPTFPEPLPPAPPEG